MSVQTNYDINPAIAVAGMVANLGVTERFAYASTGAVTFGRAVVRTAVADQCKQLTTPASEKFIGFAERIYGLENQGDTERTGYLDKETVSVIQQGYIWVTLSSDVAAGAKVYADANGECTDVSTNNLEIKGATFHTAGLDNGLAMVHLAGYRD